MLTRVRSLPRYLRDPAVRWPKKLAVLLAVAYVLFPFDLVSDLLPVLGWLDDIGVLAVMAIWLLRDLEAYVSAQRKGYQTVRSTENG
jgi:uncharacterized membrane protein YkvA (DUF1232 family)